ncbi:alpha/beta hydrolase [Streptomyces sp. NPDC048057]|uniref:alpha/beta hydrolase n=1 Tax=Streptomyces sp. NPDC048057 TaxID=3155628 RepID=UPI00340159E5
MANQTPDPNAPRGHGRPRRRAFRAFAAVGAAVVSTCLLAPSAPPAVAVEQAPADRVPAVPRGAVVRATYDLGDTAFAPKVPFQGRNELAAVVHHPRDLSRGGHPLIVMQHGQWTTCADRPARNRLAAAKRARDAALAAGDEAEAARQEKIIEAAAEELLAWPCRPGVPPLPSSAGYDYLAQELAGRGFIVVSTGVNGINATSSGQADTVYEARAELIDRHLALWRDLAAGKGPLKGGLKDTATGGPSRADFRGRIDFRRVGTLGHSMGGGGVFQHAADPRHRKWPAGVQIKAVFAIGPTANWDNEPVTKVPFAELWGSCDRVNAGQFFAWNKDANTVPIYRFTPRGGNHNYPNTQWSPSSGQVDAEDDAVPGKKPGHCLSQDGEQREDRQLDEATQRRITVEYATAFFRRHLGGDTTTDALLTGRRQLPGLKGVVGVETSKGRTP